MDVNAFRRSKYYRTCGKIGPWALLATVIFLVVVPAIIRMIAPGLGGLLIFIPFVLVFGLVSIVLFFVFWFLAGLAISDTKYPQVDLLPVTNRSSDIGFVMYAIVIVLHCLYLLSCIATAFGG